ncbi:MAG: sel1 repeat family protein [Planctomycetes bacterium]|nr:sel1 repeat family protein [Planctomycetota bacterium]
MSDLNFCGTEAPPGGAPCAAPAHGPRGIWQRVGAVPFAILAAFAAFPLLPRVAASDGLQLAFALSSSVLLAWLVVLLVVRRRLPALFALEFVPLVKSHYIQASVQFTLYAYWGWYHRDVYAQLPLILAQLVFFYAFEALLSWSRGRAWRLGCGPLPVILSTNVFLWFKDEWFVFQFLLIAVAILGKEFIQWNRDGRRRHVFNPSAFALATFALVLLLTDTTDATWAGRIADSFDKPPSIYLVIFLLGLVVQYFFSVTLITFSAVASLCLAGLVYHQVTGTYLFVFSNIPVPVFLGLHLLVTDPATSPRSDPGKVLFGALYGLSAFALYGWLAASDAPTVYDKLLPIPVLNLVVPWIERVASRGLGAVYQRWQASRAAGVPNLVHMGGWSVMFAVLLGTGYVQHEHEGTSYQFWRKAVDDGRPYAARGLVELVKSQARGGSAAAWNELGRMHLEGKLVEQDRLKAVRYFARASKLGDLAGAANLFTLYLSSDGGFGGKVVEDALTALEAACANGAEGALYYLVGNAYYLGAGRSVDREKAVALFEEGARRGDPRCKGALRSLRGGGPAESNEQ